MGLLVMSHVMYLYTDGICLLNTADNGPPENAKIVKQHTKGPQWTGIAKIKIVCQLKIPIWKF